MVTAPSSATGDKWLAPALDYIPQWLDYQMRVSDQPGCVRDDSDGVQGEGSRRRRRGGKSGGGARLPPGCRAAVFCRCDHCGTKNKVVRTGQTPSQPGLLPVTGVIQ